MENDTKNLPEEEAAPAPADAATEDERVDEAISESFPASDPPSWNAGIDKNEEEP